MAMRTAEVGLCCVPSARQILRHQWHAILPSWRLRSGTRSVQWQALERAWGSLLWKAPRGSPPNRTRYGRRAGHELVALRRRSDATDVLELRLTDDWAPPTSAVDAAALLLVGRDQRRGEIAAWLVDDDRNWQPIDEIRLIGPGMHVCRNDERRADLDHADNERWSRTIGALGHDEWSRLRSLKYAVVGLGRTGQMIAETLTRSWGVHDVKLIDPDIIELHNLGEMSLVTAEDLGQPKCRALARRLQPLLTSEQSMECVVASITRGAGYAALQDRDVVFGCVDHDAPRLALNLGAVLHGLPLVDVATGILGKGQERRMGADIRLTIPGERCLLCMGGLGDPHSARDVLSSAEVEQRFYESRDWRQERTGSLRSLNQLAASLAARLWEDFIGERVPTSVWQHVEFDSSGQLSTTQPTPRPQLDCPLCRLAGLGAEALPAARKIVQNLAAPRTSTMKRNS